MRHGIYREVFSDWGRGDRCSPVEGKVYRGEALGVVPRGVLGPVDRERGEGSREPGCRRVVGGGSACHTEGRQPSPVLAIRINRWEARLPSKDRRGGRVEAVGDPSARPVPERVHGPEGMGVGGEEVRPVSQDGEE